MATEAIREFDAGRWEEARALFLRAHGLWPSARTLRTLGMTSFELREYPRAVQELQQALKDPRRPLIQEQRDHVLALLKRAKVFVGSYQVTLEPADATLWLDGRPQQLQPEQSLQLSVGRHELVARAEGHQELRRPINTQGGEDLSLHLELIPTRTVAPTAIAPQPVTEQRPSQPAPPEGESTPATQGLFWTWVAAGSAVALGGASTYLWLESVNEARPIKDECADRPSSNPCSKEDFDVSRVDELETAYQVTLGLAIAAGAAAGVLFVLEGDSGQETELALSPQGVRVRTTF